MLNQILEQAYFNRCFELECAEYVKQGKVRGPVYLSCGAEHISATLANPYVSNFDWKIFAQHRCHSWYLAFGGNPEKLALELLGSSQGCSQGMGGSASIHIPNKMFGHSGLLGDQAPIAAGYCFATKNPTLLVLGDAAAEEDYVLGALGYIATHNLPLLVICEDNNLSILTETKVRRSWRVEDVANSMGITSYDIDDSIREISDTIDDAQNNLPAYVNIRYQRHLWHAGIGQDKKPTYDVCIDLNCESRQYIEGEVKKIWQNCVKQLSR